MKIQYLIIIIVLIALTNGCAYFSNIYERPKDYVKYNYYNDFYDEPSKTTVESLILAPYIAVLSATFEPIDTLYYEKHPKASICGLLCLTLDLPVQLVLDCSLRFTDKIIYGWWLPSYKPQSEKDYIESEEGKAFLKDAVEKSPYIIDWM